METLGQPVWFGQYRLTSRVATGGMAEVYVGRHITPEGQFGPMVAVKRLLPHLVRDSAIVRMFLNEARITAQIQHRNVVRIFELGNQNGEPFIAMELLEGRTWADLRAREAEDGKRVPLGISLFILCEACRGLDAAHNAVDDDGKPLALVHRDFTPDNIHVGVKGDVRVIDFGIAKTANWGSGTEPGTLKGKFFYMSPEMILGKSVDHRADLFAAGVMLYEQLCGRRPFTGNNVDEVVMRIAEGKLAPPSSFDPSVPKEIEKVCLVALNKNPDSRFQSLAAMVEAIEGIGGEASLATPAVVGEYVSHLFPEKSDKLRQTLKRAREVDPSVPNAKMTPTGGVVPEPVVPRPFNSEIIAPAGLGAAPVQPLTKRSRLPAIIGGLLAVLLVGGAAAYFVATQQAVPASELLSVATNASADDERARALLKLSTAIDATDGELGKGAELLIANKQWEPALEYADAWLLTSPRAVDARLLEARAALHLKRGKRFEAAVKEAAALAPDDARVDEITAEFRELQGDVPLALEAWTKLAKKRPGDRHALTRQGYWLSQTGRLDEANEVLGSVLKKQYDAEAAAELGFVKFRKEQFDEALKLLNRSVREKPDAMITHYYLATVLYRKGDLKTARSEYFEADRRAGSDTRPLIAWCELEAQQEAADGLGVVKQRIKERFPAEAAGLISKCAVAPVKP